MSINESAKITKQIRPYQIITKSNPLEKNIKKEVCVYKRFSLILTIVNNLYAMNFYQVFISRLAIALVILLSSLQLHSQITEEKKSFWSGWSININGGASLAYTDIDNYRFYRVFSNNSEWRAGYGIMLQKRIHPLMQLRGQIIYGDLSGTKRRYNYWFEADYLETSLSGTLDLIGLFGGSKVRVVNFYGMLGIGFTQWRTDLKTLDNNEPLSGNGNQGSGIGGRTLEAVIPFGLGLDFNVSYHWNINIEASLRLVNSDLLDAKEAGFQYDFYSYNFVGVTYKFKKKRKKEPEIPPMPLIAEEEPQELKRAEPTKEPEEERLVVNEEQQNLLKLLQEQMLKEEGKTGMYESPWSEVEFTVQVAASRTAIDPSLFQEKFNISGEISRTHSEGWYYYTIGKYVKYWRAREYRNILLTRNNTQGAFVVAFKNGKRLSITELLSQNSATQTGQRPPDMQRPISKKSYSVQVMATRDGNVSPVAIREMYEIDIEVYKEYADGWYRYIVGNFMDYSQASKLRNKLRIHGMREAFIVGYKDGKRVPIETLRD